MMSESESTQEEKFISEILLSEKGSSGDGTSISQWSSFNEELSEENKKRALQAEGLYSPGSGEICSKYITMSDSNINIHPYYQYPAILDPGILKALNKFKRPFYYKDDGQDLYLALCAEMTTPPVRLFHKGLVTEAINLRYYGVNPYGVRPMAIALHNNQIVQRLDLTDNFLNDDACYHLGQMLTMNSSIKELILTGCRIGASGILRLGSSLSVNKSLITISISKNCLGEDGGVYFAKQIGNGATVPQVCLSKNDLGRLTALALAEALEYRNKLTHLDLSWNNFFNAPSTVKMLEQLSYGSTLQELNLAWNALVGEKVASAITYILCIPSLKVLNLSNNRFQGEALILILEGLNKAKKLVTLDLSFNPMSTEDAYHALEKMLKPRVKLQNLYLEGVVVEKKFLALLDRVKGLKFRTKFSIKYGRVLRNWTVRGPDARKLIMERMNYLGMRDRKRRVDVALFFLRIGKQLTKPIPVQELMYLITLENIPLDEDLVNELCVIFAGSKSAKNKTVNIQMICEYINRIWPDKKLPPTPPPEPDQEEEPQPPTPPTPPTKEKE